MFPRISSPLFSHTNLYLSLSLRGKLRELFPSTSFSGGVYLNDTGYDLLTRLLSMDPKQVRGEALFVWAEGVQRRECVCVCACLSVHVYVFVCIFVCKIV